MLLCCSCSSNRNSISFIHIFISPSSVHMCFMDSHIVLYCTVFLSLLYDSALATIILKATWLELFPWESVADSCPCTVSHYMLAHGSQKRAWPRGGWLKTHDVKMTDQFQDMKLQDMKLQDRLQDTKMQDINMTDQVRLNRLSRRKLSIDWNCRRKV